MIEILLSGSMTYRAYYILTSNRMTELRLGDEIDDYCVKCRRMTNHSIVSLVGAQAAKVRCRSCYSDHDFRHGEIPPSKRELAKQKLMNAVLSNASGTEQPPAVEKGKKKKA